MSNSSKSIQTYKELADKFIGNMSVAINIAGEVFTRDGANGVDYVRDAFIRMGMERKFTADVHVIDSGASNDEIVGDLHYVEGCRSFINEVRRVQRKKRDATLLVISFESIMSGDVNRHDIELLAKDYAAVIVQCNSITKELPAL